MYSLELIITTALVTLIIGAVLGYFITLRTGAAQRSQQHLESQLSELQQQTQNYRQEVADHFNETAELLNKLTESYRDVHVHLAKGAQTLLNENTPREKLKMISVDGEKVTTSDETQNLTPPLDYAVNTSASDSDDSEDDYDSKGYSEKKS